jgi:hypothetical protein
MYSIEQIANKIQEIIRNSPTKTLLGNQVGYLLKYSFPDFSTLQYQSRNLRQFIKQHAPTIQEKGRAGMDVIYGLRSTAFPSATAPAPAPIGPLRATPLTPVPPSQAPDFVPYMTGYEEWKAFSNPSYPFILAANRETGGLRVIQETETPEAPWVAIPKPTAAFHAEMASEFVSALPQPQKMALEEVLKNPKWYVQFSFEARRNGLGEQWAAVRRSKLNAKLGAALSELGVEPVQSQDMKTGRVQSRFRVRTSADSITEEARFRNLVQRIINELPTSELRLLRLPVGVVFDALKK